LAFMPRFLGFCFAARATWLSATLRALDAFSRSSPARPHS
jgi:hypothetical protein